jgi:hypothetical protein
VHAVVTQIPDSGLRLTRSYGAYANRLRRSWDGLRVGRGRAAPTCAAGIPEGKDEPRDSEFVRKRKAAWARLLRKVLEVDPLTCPRCGSELQIVAVITQPEVVDRILRHVAQTGRDGVHEQRGPPDPRPAVHAGSTE